MCQGRRPLASSRGGAWRHQGGRPWDPPWAFRWCKPPAPLSSHQQEERGVGNLGVEHLRRRYFPCQRVDHSLKSSHARRQRKHLGLKRSGRDCGGAPSCVVARACARTRPQRADMGMSQGVVLDGSEGQHDDQDRPGSARIDLGRPRSTWVDQRTERKTQIR